ncbi:MAG: hypothetical protein QOG88_113 [Actinomycetota bacterium]|nr:hypothetical protein [Actinomycetota bacterium]
MVHRSCIGGPCLPERVHPSRWALYRRQRDLHRRRDIRSERYARDRSSAGCDDDIPIAERVADDGLNNERLLQGMDRDPPAPCRRRRVVAHRASQVSRLGRESPERRAGSSQARRHTLRSNGRSGLPGLEPLNYRVSSASASGCIARRRTPRTAFSRARTSASGPRPRFEPGGHVDRVPRQHPIARAADAFLIHEDFV